MQNFLRCDNTIIYINMIAIMEDFIVSKEINYVYMALSQSKFVLLDLFIAVNISKCEKTLCFLCKNKKNILWQLL